MEKFGLQLHPDKTRLIEFGRFAAGRRTERGLGKPEPFDFLGFTHYCGKTRAGKFKLKRKTIAKRLRAALQQVKLELRRRMHLPVNDVGRWLRSVVQGWYNYHAAPRSAATGSASCDAAARKGGRNGPGTGCVVAWSGDGSPVSGYCILIPTSV